MAIGTVADSRLTTWGVTSSGMARVDVDFFDLVKTRVSFVDETWEVKSANLP